MKQGWDNQDKDQMETEETFDTEAQSDYCIQCDQPIDLRKQRNGFCSRTCEKRYQSETIGHSKPRRSRDDDD